MPHSTEHYASSYGHTQPSQALTSTPRATYARLDPGEVCVELRTTTPFGYEEVLPLSLDTPVIIGRNPALCTYVIDEIVVSSVHCKIQVIQSDDGSLIVSCNDVSTNGLWLNRYRIRRSAVILMDEDVLEIPQAQVFHVAYLVPGPTRQKAHLFDEPLVPSGQARSIGDFVVLPHALGSGAFAEVHLAFYPKRCMQVACKTIKIKVRPGRATSRGPSRKKNHKQEFESVLKERDILMDLSHPNIIRVFDAVPDYENNFLHIFLELCTGGDLFTYLTSHSETEGRLGEGETKYIMFQLFKALDYLHHRQIAHRDLKPENVLLHSPGPFPRVLIADFGLARPRSTEETLNVCGTVAYLSPEACNTMDRKTPGYVGLPADCWSAGVLMFIMLAGYHPFDRGLRTWDTYLDIFGRDTLVKAHTPRYAHAYELPPGAPPPIQNDKTTMWRIRVGAGEIDFDADEWACMRDAKGLVLGLLEPCPTERFTIERAMASWWIRKDREQLERAWRRMSNA